jgi:hypothetical protein
MIKPIGATEALGLAAVQSDQLDRDERSPWTRGIARGWQ